MPAPPRRRRHWGDLDADDRAANDATIRNGEGRTVAVLAAAVDLGATSYPEQAGALRDECAELLTTVPGRQAIPHRLPPISPGLAESAEAHDRSTDQHVRLSTRDSAGSATSSYPVHFERER